jgi:hypothetical protein
MKGLQMNAVEVGEWSANWAWSLPLIVLSVVILVIGLGLINEGVVHVLSGAMGHRQIISKFAAVHGPYCDPISQLLRFGSSVGR